MSGFITGVIQFKRVDWLGVRAVVVVPGLVPVVLGAVGEAAVVGRQFAEGGGRALTGRGVVGGHEVRDGHALQPLGRQLFAPGLGGGGGEGRVVGRDFVEEAAAVLLHRAVPWSPPFPRLTIPPAGSASPTRGGGSAFLFFFEADEPLPVCLCQLFLRVHFDLIRFACDVSWTMRFSTV